MDPQTRIAVQYFAAMREQAGRAEETVTTAARTAAQLYAQLRTRHGFTLDAAHLRVSVNGAFAAWDATLHEGDCVVFIPPVAGG